MFIICYQSWQVDWNFEKRFCCWKLSPTALHLVLAKGGYVLGTNHSLFRILTCDANYLEMAVNIFYKPRLRSAASWWRGGGTRRLYRCSLWRLYCSSRYHHLTISSTTIHTLHFYTGRYISPRTFFPEKDFTVLVDMLVLCILSSV